MQPDREVGSCSYHVHRPAVVVKKLHFLNPRVSWALVKARASVIKHEVFKVRRSRLAILRCRVIWWLVEATPVLSFRRGPQDQGLVALYHLAGVAVGYKSTLVEQGCLVAEVLYLLRAV